MQIGLGEDTDDNKTAQELAATKDALAQKIQTLKLSESMAKDVTFLVWTQFSRKKKRMQHHSVRCRCFGQGILSCASQILAMHTSAVLRVVRCSVAHIQQCNLHAHAHSLA